MATRIVPATLGSVFVGGGIWNLAEPDGRPDSAARHIIGAGAVALGAGLLLRGAANHIDGPLANTWDQVNPTAKKLALAGFTAQLGGTVVLLAGAKRANAA